MRRYVSADLPADYAERVSDVDDSAWLARVEELIRDADWQEILAGKERDFLLDLISECHDRPEIGKKWLDDLVQDWAERKADDDY